MSEASPAPHRLITDPEALQELLQELRGEEVFALDTEFHRERTYRPRLALVQVAWSGGVALIDPLELDPSGLAELFAGGNEVVLHAAQQDLDVLKSSVAALPKRIFDTQLAAGFLGMSSPSLTAVCERFMGIVLPKAERMTDWLIRPLSDKQQAYAAADVAHLLALRDVQTQELQRRGRILWAEEEAQLLVGRAARSPAPEEAWRRIKGANKLSSRNRAVLVQVAAWRERRAARLDKPLRWVMSDMAVLNMAERAPTNRSKLASVRGIDRSLAEGRVGSDLLDAIQQGLSAPPPEPAEDGTPLPQMLKPLVPLVSAWVSQVGHDEELDPTLLASRRDIEDLLRNHPGARLSHGWRAELLGEPIRQLLSGEVAIAFEGEGRLVLESRPGR